jgi:hypothetical protein
MRMEEKQDGWKMAENTFSGEIIQKEYFQE